MRFNFEFGSWVLLFVVVAWLSAASGGATLAAISTAILAVSALLIQYVCNPFDPHRLTIQGIWYAAYIATNMIPAYVVFADHPGPFRVRYLFSVLSVLVITPLGMVVTNCLMGGRKSQADKFFQSQIAASQITPGLTRAFKWLLASVLLFTILYVVEVPSIPLLHLLRAPDDYWELVLLREESFKLLDSRFYYVYYLLKMLLYPFCVMLSLGAYLATRARKWLVMFAITFAGGLFYNSLTLAKAPIGFMFIAAAAFIYFYRGRRLRWRTMVWALGLFLSFPVVILMALSDYSPGAALVALAGRLFYLPAELTYYYFELFPAQVGFLHGASIRTFARVIGIRFFDIENYVGLYAVARAPDSVSAPAAFIGYLNADFGLPGVLIGGILAGMVMEALHLWYVRQPKSVAVLTGYAFLVFAFLFLNLMSFTGVLAGNGVLLSVLLTIVLARTKGPRTRRATLESGQQVR